MQDIHTIGGGGGGRFYGGGGGGDRRLRLHNHQTLGGQSPKCPRCDSANTKFCYYNNYNLSQPRHFCKSCRRYWTKGGVLRNVPVGGGCRKTKRSSSSSAKSKVALKSNNSQSSSDSSSLTAPAAAPEVASASAPIIINFSQAEVTPSFDPLTSSSDHVNPSFVPIASSSNPANPSFAPMVSSSDPMTSSSGQLNPSFDPLTSSSGQLSPSFVPMTSSSDPSPGGDIYSGSFTSMMTSSTDPMMELGFGVDQSLGHPQWTRQQGDITEEPATTTMPEELKISSGFLDPLAQMDHELFDLSGTVDQAYWTQPQWNDNDHALYLP